MFYLLILRKCVYNVHNVVLFLIMHFCSLPYVQ